MIKIKFLKDTELKKKGDVVSCSKKSAESSISQGYAEYVKEPKKKKVVKKKPIKKVEKIDKNDFDEKKFYEKYSGKITCAFKKNIFLDKKEHERCNAKRTAERDKYILNELTDDICLIEVPKDLVALEFEKEVKINDELKTADEKQRKKWIQETKENAQGHKLDWCIAGHGGTSDYLYICNIENLIENKEHECKKEIAKLIVPKDAWEFLDKSNLGNTLIPIINRPHWKIKKYNGAIHKILEGKNPDKHKNKCPDIVIQRVIDNERPNFPKFKVEADSDINSIPITQVIPMSGLKKRGAEYQGSNPWHGSTTGLNFNVNPSKNAFNCWRCGGGGGVAKAIGLNKGIINNCDEDLSTEQFKEVLEIAREDYGLKKPEPKKPEKKALSNDLKTFIFDESKIVKTLVFTSHKLKDNIFGFGIKLPRTEDYEDSKGKIIGQKQVWRPVIITSNKRGLVISEWMKNEYKIQYDSIPYEMSLRWELKDVDNYLHGEIQKIDGKELFEEIVNEYKYYCYYREKNWYSVNALWDTGTYFHQLCSSFPLKEERGIASTGKTKGMVVSSNITLNSTGIMTNPSESTLFRITEELRPTKYIDEAEKLFKFTKDGLEADNRVELINASYTRNGAVPRQEKIGNKYFTKWYRVYSPTRIASINGLYGATETRAITQIHTKSPDSDCRGERDPEDDVNNIKWRKIRNKLYRFTLQEWDKFYSNYIQFDIKCKLKKRDLQIWKPLLVLAKIIDEKDLLPQIIDFSEKISLQRKNDLISEGTLDYKYLKCLNELLLVAKSERIYVEAIRQKYNLLYDATDEKKSNKSISIRLDKLGFKELRAKDMHGAYYDLTKTIFDEIISPITNDFSSYSSEPSDNKESNSNSNDECMTNDDDSSKKEKIRNDENDESDEYDDGLGKNILCPNCKKFLTPDEKDNYKIGDIAYCYDCFEKKLGGKK